MVRYVVTNQLGTQTEIFVNSKQEAIDYIKKEYPFQGELELFIGYYDLMDSEIIKLQTDNIE